MAKSVMMLTGAEDRYRVMMSMQVASLGTGVAKVAEMGIHWRILRSVRARPATFTIAKVDQVALRNILLVLESDR